VAELLTLVAETLPDAEPVPAPYSVRPTDRSDIDALGRVYFEAYEPGVAWPSLAEAVTDIEASFDGAYGPLVEAASPAAFLGDERVAAVLTVQRAPWPDTPDCPFIIEAFTARAHRRRGLARALVTIASGETSRRGDPCIGLRVASDNTPALRLYRSLGFSSWAPV
jgi:N-alpha-acetyltransferase 10/11